MKNIKNIILGCVVVVSFSACSVTYPQAVSASKIGAKKGASKTLVLFGSKKTPDVGIYLNSDFGVAEAAKKGKIKGSISTVDMKVTKYLGWLVHTRELMVTGNAE